MIQRACITTVGIFVIATLLLASYTRAQDNTTPDTTAAPAEEELISLSFRDMSIDNIAQFLSEKTGKPVIPHESIKSQRITIVSVQKYTLADAMLVIREALQQKGIIIEEYPRLVNLKPIAEARRSNLPVVDANRSISELPDKALIVDKIFVTQHFDVVKLMKAIEPMLSEFAHITADPNSRKLVVTDTVSNLERIERVIQQLDVELANQTINKIFELKDGDAADIVGVIEPIIAGTLGKEGKVISTATGQPSSSGGPRRGGPPGRGGPGGPGGNGNSRGAASTAAIAATDAPVLLVPEVTRNWIIAVAPAHIMAEIEKWVIELDKPRPMTTNFDIHSVEYVDANEVADQITRALETHPQQDLKTSTRIAPFAQSRKLIVFGSQRGRDFVRDLLGKLDLDQATSQEMRVITLKYADAETVAKNIEELFSNRYIQYQSSYSTSYSIDRSTNIRVKVSADPIRNAITVFADSQTMEKIVKAVNEQWDLPLDAEDVQPRVYILTHADALQVKDLLENLFSKQERSFSYFDYFYRDREEETTPAGRLFGQFAFQAMPDSNRLVVTTNNAQNYHAIDDLIRELDQPQEAGLPRVIELKHANAEDLAEQVNAALAEPGTLAEILRSRRTLSGTSQTSSVTANLNQQQQQQRNQQGPGGEQTDPRTMSFWWQRARPRTDEKPSSNLIGKIRIVPITRRNALLVLAPGAYLDPIEEMVLDLDRPGLQVIIHAIIAEVEHSDATTLGMRFASDPSLFSDPALIDQSAGGSLNADFNELFGGTFAIGGDTFGRRVLDGNLNINVLLQFLIRRFGLKILQEPKIYTSDNQEAQIFDGQFVPVQTSAQSSPEGSSVRQSFTYRPVGTTLRVRPHITKEGDVDLLIYLELSRTVPGESIFGNPVFDQRETETNVVVRDGQTVMISGIVQQDDFDDVRKLPLFGDLPLVGPVFRSTQKTIRNRELIAFITPYVVATDPEQVEATMQMYRQRLENLRHQMEVVEPDNEQTDGQRPKQPTEESPQ